MGNHRTPLVPVRYHRKIEVRESTNDERNQWSIKAKGKALFTPASTLLAAFVLGSLCLRLLSFNRLINPLFSLAMTN